MKRIGFASHSRPSRTTGWPTRAPRPAWSRASLPGKPDFEGLVARRSRDQRRPHRRHRAARHGAGRRGRPHGAAWCGRASSTSTPISTRAISGRARPIPDGSFLGAVGTTVERPRGALARRGRARAHGVRPAAAPGRRARSPSARTSIRWRRRPRSPGRCSRRCATPGPVASSCRRPASCRWTPSPSRRARSSPTSWPMPAASWAAVTRLSGGGHEALPPEFLDLLEQHLPAGHGSRPRHGPACRRKRRSGRARR